jgi:hypothetical protein
VAVFQIPPNAFGTQQVFVSLALSEYSLLASAYQQNLRALSPAVEISTNNMPLERPGKLRINFSSRLLIDKSRVSVFKISNNGKNWERLQSEIDFSDTSAVTYINSPGVYVVVEDSRGVIGGPSTGSGLDKQSIYFYPNPFDPSKDIGRIRYSLKTDGFVTVKIYDVSNSLVRTFEPGLTPSMVEQSVEWDAKDANGIPVSNGLYIYVIESSSGEKAVGKVAVLR